MNPRTLVIAVPFAALLVVGVWLGLRTSGDPIVDTRGDSFPPASSSSSAEREAKPRVAVGSSHRQRSQAAHDPGVVNSRANAVDRVKEAATPEGSPGRATRPQRPTEANAARTTSPEPGQLRPLYGTVFSAEGGDSVSAAEVTITAWEGSRRPQRRRVVSNSDGVFDFGSVPSGWVNLRVRHRGHLTLDVADVSVTGAPLELAVSAGGVLDGAVYDQDGQTLPHARIELRNAQGKAVRVTRSDASGEFRVSAIPPGRYDVAVVSGNTVSAEEGGEGEAADRSVLAKTQIQVEIGDPISIELRIQGK
ncbi:MAG: carboxypeptidase-like regulatory domain-containing protein [Planctomycetota bacterium]